MNLCALRMLGLGDVTSIGVPAARWLRAHHPDDRLWFLTYGAGAEVMDLVSEVDRVIGIGKEDWPDDLVPGMRSFGALGERLLADGVDLLVNFDTWFLPCFLTRTLHDAGLPIAGNSLRWPVAEFLERVRSGAIDQQTVQNPARYIESTFPRFADWTRPWWQETPDAGPYPDYYLRHCCGFDGPLDPSLDAPADHAFRRAAGDRPLVALAMQGRTRTRGYPHTAALHAALEDAGFCVWSHFDGSQPMETTLGRLRVSDLLIGVASAPQWLARAVGCPVLMVPGTVPPAVLGADATVERRTDCQYCMQPTCGEERDFECLDVAPATIVEHARALLAARDAAA